MPRSVSSCNDPIGSLQRLCVATDTKVWRPRNQRHMQGIIARALQSFHERFTVASSRIVKRAHETVPELSNKPTNHRPTDRSAIWIPASRGRWDCKISDRYSNVGSGYLYRDCVPAPDTQLSLRSARRIALHAITTPTTMISVEMHSEWRQ